MKPLLFSLFGASALSERLIEKLNVDRGHVMLHRFPDEESYVRIDTPIKERDLIVVDSLTVPNQKLMPLLFFAKTAQELGAKKVGLIAPYLAYLRQDKRFHEGEAITSRYVAQWLSDAFDWLLTVDPHLHRYKSLDEIYTIPTFVVHATTPIACWIKNNIPTPLLIGPDMESQQWVAEIASQGNFPYLILEKTRYGDKEVSISLPSIEQFKSCTPVLVDDIISTARTMVAAVKQLQKIGYTSIHCIGVHALFSEDAYAILSKMEGVHITTCNTIYHKTNAIDVSDLIMTTLMQHRLVAS
ncbi:ribose-phosphate pyrophosphokinase [Legionella sp. PATHC038]|uniref:ribose-phosphate pyrophosphokinase n=1 Tax=Legionella sheltonii TaxID=2992041 RepID=UPI002243C26D|nr:ribose-phosphate pyrophosphokinase [Legionella sp. PATHC038]MCW8399423.1 ribose-phosphate pyrophosphokinase [Legionella sp. PATHC038]